MANKNKKQWPCDSCGQILEWSETEKGFRPVLVGTEEIHLTKYCKGSNNNAEVPQLRPKEPQPRASITDSRNEAIKTVDNVKDHLNSVEAQEIRTKVNYIAEFCRKMDNMKLVENNNSANGTIDEKFRQLIIKMAETIGDMSNTIELIAIQLNIPLPGREPKPAQK